MSFKIGDIVVLSNPDVVSLHRYGLERGMVFTIEYVSYDPDMIHVKEFKRGLYHTELTVVDIKNSPLMKALKEDNELV